MLMTYSSIGPRRAGLRAALFVVSACVLLTGTQHVSAATEPAAVEINRFQFEPQELTISRGATVTWTNRDQTVHNVVAKDGKFTSSGLDTGDRFSFHFDHDGDYAYFCALHPHMVGVVHVRGP
jgi:plastocyanin